MNKTNIAVSDLQKLLTSENTKEELLSALPKHMDADRFIRIATTAILRNPKLKETSKQSFSKCILDLAAFGLEPDGRNSHLIPRPTRNGMECTLIIDYKGKIALMLRSGEITRVHLDKVCENDIFETNKGALIKHEINYREERGATYAYYALLQHKSGSETFVVMTKHEVNEIRDKCSSAEKARRSGKIKTTPWVENDDEMGKKTVLHRASKYVELCPELRDIYDRELQQELKNITPRNIPEVQTKELEELPPEVSDDTIVCVMDTLESLTEKEELIEFWTSLNQQTKSVEKIKLAYLAKAESFTDSLREKVLEVHKK